MKFESNCCYMPRVLSRTFVWREVDSKKKIGAMQRREKFLLDLGGVRGHAQQENFEKIVFRIG